jgi:hypothetical protein
MRLVYDKEIFIDVLKAVEMKGKWFSGGTLKADSLGEYVKIIANADTWRMGYFFINGNNQTFISYYIPAVIEKNEEAVLEISKVLKYLKNMSGEVTIDITNGCQILCGSKKALIPVSVLHPNDIALSRLFESTHDIVYSELVRPIDWGNEGTTSKLVLDNGFKVNGSKLSKVMSTCESVGHGVYNFTQFDGVFTVTSSMGNEHYLESLMTPVYIGGATVHFTGPLHKALSNEPYNLYFNIDSLLLIVGSNICIVRAPYVMGE